MKALNFPGSDRLTKSRRKYLKLQDALTKAARAELTEPDVQGIVDRNDGTLHKDCLKSDLIVEIPEWPFLPEDPGDYVTLQLQFALTGAEGAYTAIGPVERFDYPLTSDMFPLELSFPQQSIPRNGKLWIRYELYDHLPNRFLSKPIELICDSVAPWGDEPAPPLIPVLPVTGIINKDYLTAKGGIELEIPAYPDKVAGDNFQLFYLKEWPEEDADYENPVAVGAVPDDLKITLPADVVTPLGDGRFYIVYYLFDKAFNRSRIRLPATVDVVLTDEPAALQLPRVPLAQDDGVLSLADAQTKAVFVEVDVYDNHQHGDRIAVKWGSRPLDKEQVGSRGFPIPIRVPDEVLRDEYGKATGVVSTPVSYQVLRGEAAYGPAADNFAVDFSVVGPERPDPDDGWPDPVNDKMLAPQIISFTGQTDAIIPADRGQEASLTFEVFEGAVDGLVVDFYWGGTRVTEAQWIVDQVPGTEKTVTIPWDYIQDAGNNPALPVHYAVHSGVEPRNEQESIIKFVAVSAIDMTPDDLEFLGVTDRGWLSCASIWDPANPGAAPAIRVQVPPCSRFNVPPNTTMRLTWVVYDATSGGTLIPGLEKSEPVMLSAEQINNGFVWRVEPYDVHIQPIFGVAPTGGRAEVSYVIEMPTDIVSDPTTNRINISDQSTGGSCDLNMP